MTTAQTIIMTKLHTGAQDYPLLARCVIGSDTRGSRRASAAGPRDARGSQASKNLHTLACDPRASHGLVPAWGWHATQEPGN